MEFPRLYLVRQHFPDRSLRDIPREVHRELEAAGLAPGLKPGARIAIGVGSRGIANLATIVRSAVDYWKARGAQPFIFPAMGSHGAATAEGQAQVLARFGIDETSMGCPIRSSLDVVSLGTTEHGIDVLMDKAAWESDGVMLIARVKWHTDFEGGIESGLFKMMAIGMGKCAGAQRYHIHAYRMGLEAVILEAGRRVLESGKMVGGLAILEDANHNTARIAALGPRDMEQRERELLAEVKSWMGRIPVEQVDILILDEIGKEISGAGMDTKVVNRIVHGTLNPWPNAPKVERIFLRGLSANTYGNAVGVGMADMVLDRLVQRIDPQATAINALTAGSLAAVRTPVHFPTDRECLEKLAFTVGRLDPKDLRMVWIQNTLKLGWLGISETLLPEVSGNPAIEVVGSPFEIPFDGQGMLPELASLSPG